MSAELLAQAAERVERLGAAATANICPAWQQQAVRHIARNVDIECPTHDDPDPDPEHDECASWARYESAPWMSLMDPRLAEPLAAWLRSAMDDGNPHAAEVARLLTDRTVG